MRVPSFARAQRDKRVLAAWVLVVLLAACIVRLWLVPLPSSFWVDEMVTAFVVHYGPQHPSLAAAPQVIATVYYSLPRASEALFGFSETAFRIPSVLLMGLALLLLARLASRLIHPQAAWFTVFACLALRAFNYQAADARPYALGTCVAAASALCLVRWLDNARRSDELLFVLFGALLWRVHLIYWPFYPVLGIYAVLRLVRRETRVGWMEAAAVFALLGILLVPVLFNALAIGRQGKVHVIVPLPSLDDLRTSLKMTLIVQCGILAWALSVLFRWARNSEPLPLSSQILIFGWWLCQPLGLFLYSEITGNSVFVVRYLSLALPGAALTATLAAAYFLPVEQWKTASIVLAAGVLLLVGQWREASPRHDVSDWRTAAQAVNHWTLGSTTPVICPSPFIEARPPIWRSDYQVPGFLYAYLPVYRLAGKPYLFPFEHSLEAEHYAEELSSRTLAVSPRFLIYGGDRNVHFWRDWFAQRPEFSTWPNRLLGPFGDVEVALFENPKFTSLATAFSGRPRPSRHTLSPW
jgi:hypothetical protein